MRQHIEINHRDIKIKDIFFQGNYIHYPSPNIIVLITGKGEREGTYAGVAVNGTPSYEAGYYCSSWSKDRCNQFYGEILIKQE